jgi:hypothetical protein
VTDASGLGDPCRRLSLLRLGWYVDVYFIVFVMS